jgi:hypothetical protein
VRNDLAPWAWREASTEGCASVLAGEVVEDDGAVGNHAFPHDIIAAMAAV